MKSSLSAMLLTNCMLALLLQLGCSDKKTVNGTIGTVAPEIVGRDIDGNTLKLSDYRGRVVVLDFWGHW